MCYHFQIEIPKRVIMSSLRSLNVSFFQIEIPNRVISSGLRYLIMSFIQIEISKHVLISRRRSLNVSLFTDWDNDTFRDFNLEIMTHLGISIWKHDAFRDLLLEIMTHLRRSLVRTFNFFCFLPHEDVSALIYDAYFCDQNDLLYNISIFIRPP